MDLFGEAPAPEPDEPEVETFQSAYFDDEPEGFDHPRLMSNAQGHEDIESHLIDLFKSGRMPHGLIFSGPKGIGKATTAYRVARFFLKHGNFDPNQSSMFGDAEELPANMQMPREDRVFKLVASAGHPDLLTVERAYDAVKNKLANSVAVADIRKVNPFLRMTASDGGWRVVVIDDADTMNRSAQNALLKILEEPPKNTLLILVAHRVGALIPTIRSRAQVINMHAPPLEVFTSLLKQNDSHIDPDHITTLYHLSKGSFGDALQYIEDDGLETLSSVLDMLKTAPHWNWPLIHKMGGDLGRAGKDDAYKNFTKLLIWVFTQMTTAKARGRDLEVETLRVPAIEAMMAQSSLETLLETCDNLSNHFLRVERANLDKKQAVLRAFSIIAA
jgi:DNA polymerase-3 subunit delta'